MSELERRERELHLANVSGHNPQHVAPSTKVANSFDRWRETTLLRIDLSHKIMEQSGEITRLLREWGEGKPVDTDHLFRMVYPQLHLFAVAFMRRERPGHLLQPTSVVNEMFLRLVQQRKLDFENRQHFYSFAARLMRRVLVDAARNRKRSKRDGGEMIPLSDDLLWTDALPEVIFDLDRAMNELEALDERKCRMVEMRFLLGFTADETADLLSLSKSSVDRDLRFARSWLQHRLETAKFPIL